MAEQMDMAVSGDSTQMMSTLMHIQELFYNRSSHKDGPNAGKVNKDQLKESKFAQPAAWKPDLTCFPSAPSSPLKRAV